MKDYILHQIIEEAKKQNNAVELYINFIHERIIIEPEQETDYVDNGVISIDENTYISTEYVSMAKIIMNNQERMKQLKDLIDEVKGENNVQIGTD